MAAENIDDTENGTGPFNTKIPGLGDPADIQAALRLYHYGSDTYDAAAPVPGPLPIPSIANYLKTLVDADATEIVARNAAIAAHNAATTNVHGILNTANLASQAYVINAIEGAAAEYPNLAGDGLEWNGVDERFDIDPTLLNNNTVTIKTSSFTLDPLDVNKTIFLQTSSPMNLTVPANSAVNIPIGYKYNLVEIGSGKTTFVPSSGVTIGSKNSQLFLDGTYSKGTLVKISTDSWVLYGDVYEGVAVAPTPVAPTPVAPTPVAPTPVAPTPVAPTPVAPTPVAPTPVAPTPVAPTPVAPTPVAPTPVAPTPVAPTPVAPTPVAPTPVAPTPVAPTPVAPTPVAPTPVAPTPPCNPDWSLIPQSQCAACGLVWSPEFGECIEISTPTPTPPCNPDWSLIPQSQCAACGLVWSPEFGECISVSPTPVAPTPVAPTPVAPTPVAPTPVAPTPVAPTPVAPVNMCADLSILNQSQCQACGGYYSTLYGECQSTPWDTPTPVAPTPVAPTPVAPTPVAPTPVAPTPVAPTPVAPTPVDCSTCVSYGGPCGTYGNGTWCITPGACPNICQGDYAPTPVAPVPPAPVAPTPVAPTPVAPTPVAPTPVAPTPVAPTPVAPTPTGGCTGCIRNYCFEPCPACCDGDCGC